MKILLRLVLMLPLAVLVSLGVVVWAMFSAEPAVNRAAELTPARIADGKHILEQNDPRQLRAGEVRRVSVSAQDLDLALN